MKAHSVEHSELVLGFNGEEDNIFDVKITSLMVLKSSPISWKF